MLGYMFLVHVYPYGIASGAALNKYLPVGQKDHVSTSTSITNYSASTR